MSARKKLTAFDRGVHYGMLWMLGFWCLSMTFDALGTWIWMLVTAAFVLGMGFLEGWMRNRG